MQGGSKRVIGLLGSVQGDWQQGVDTLACADRQAANAVTAEERLHATHEFRGWLTETGDHALKSFFVIAISDSS